MIPNDRRAPWCLWLIESTRDVVEYGGSLHQSKWTWGTLLECGSKGRW